MLGLPLLFLFFVNKNEQRTDIQTPTAMKTNRCANQQRAGETVQYLVNSCRALSSNRCHSFRIASSVKTFRLSPVLTVRCFTFRTFLFGAAAKVVCCTVYSSRERTKADMSAFTMTMGIALMTMEEQEEVQDKEADVIVATGTSIYLVWLALSIPFCVAGASPVFLTTTLWWVWAMLSPLIPLQTSTCRFSCCPWA